MGAGRGGRDGRAGLQMARVKLLGWWTYSPSLSVVMISRVYSYIKAFRITYFKYMQFIIFQLYLNKCV